MGKPPPRVSHLHVFWQMYRTRSCKPPPCLWKEFSLNHPSPLKNIGIHKGAYADSCSGDYGIKYVSINWEFIKWTPYRRPHRTILYALVYRPPLPHIILSIFRLDFKKLRYIISFLHRYVPLLTKKGQIRRKRTELREKGRNWTQKGHVILYWEKNGQRNRIWGKFYTNKVP